ncbi:XDD3 family exosortase-dependent surface protein [Roseofilum casamattae]|uniref:PEP-CTERM sorting domain-containing protein n=1 Tax=Roseofilum casamattae BLCC-M143 TaxID=3022442 RepID=A0ABT7C1R5_9CYAN|nr:XDD3 family exosortase-dependent surface protein [Roseofilum casamattae]MDJ1184699.1 PEP-CTERM sorting domain-containing protein [Roseofilum casamattae BLCC-M143]
MKFNSLQTFIGTAATAACLLGMTGIAQAEPLIESEGWNYARDYSFDGTGGYSWRTDPETGARYKTSAYEIYGLAIHQEGETVTVGINANMGIDGNYFGGAADNNVGWGDFMFNAGGENYAVHFSQDNDSFGRGNRDSALDDLAPRHTLGLYKDITTKDVSALNSGWSSLQSHYNSTKNRSVNVAERNAGIKSFGDLEGSEMDFYTQRRSSGNAIASGTKVENDNFQLLTGTQLSGLGLDFGNAFDVANHRLGTHTFGFSFTRTPEMLGDFVAHLFAECINDGAAIVGKFEEVVAEVSVPEPGAIGGLAVLGLMVAGSKLRKRG